MYHLDINTLKAKIALSDLDQIFIFGVNDE